MEVYLIIFIELQWSYLVNQLTIIWLMLVYSSLANAISIKEKLQKIDDKKIMNYFISRVH